MSDISIVVATGENDVIGRAGSLPAWKLPDDLARFRQITTAGPVIMGRKTYDSIGRPLPKRRNIVISRQAGLTIPGCDVVATLAAALALAETENTAEIFIIGGGQIYAEALPLATKLYLTRVHAAPDGDTFFRFNPADWHEDWREEHSEDERNDHAFTFINYTRI